MRAAGVVVHPPRLDEGAGRRQAPEQMLVQALVAQAAVDTLDGAVLLRLAGRDVVPLNCTLFLPAQDGVRGQLGAVVRADHQQLAPAGDDRVEFTRDPPPGQRGVDHQRQALPRAVIEHDEDAHADEAARRLVSIPGVGPMTATALRAAVDDGSAFASARDLPAWLGLVPRQHTTGGKPKLLGISKRGNAYLRGLFIHGARAALASLSQVEDATGRWLRGLLARAHYNVCPTSAPVGQIEGLHEGRMAGSS